MGGIPKLHMQIITILLINKILNKESSKIIKLPKLEHRHTDFINGLRPLRLRHTDLTDFNGCHGLIFRYNLELRS